MKINYFLTLIVSLLFVHNIWGQCTNTSAYGTVTAPTAGTSTTISTVQYATEYATINSAVSGAKYISTSSVATDFITIRQGTYNGTVVAFGQTPLQWIAPAAGNYYQHTNINSICGTAAASRTTAISRTTDYCSPTFGSGVEPISHVIFGSINNSTPTTGGLALESFTNQIATVEQGKTYTIQLAGNTAGNYTNYFRAYFD